MTACAAARALEAMYCHYRSIGAKSEIAGWIYKHMQECDCWRDDDSLRTENRLPDALDLAADDDEDGALVVSGESGTSLDAGIVLLELRTP